MKKYSQVLYEHFITYNWKFWILLMDSISTSSVIIALQQTKKNSSFSVLFDLMFSRICPLIMNVNSREPQKLWFFFSFYVWFFSFLWTPFETNNHLTLKISTEVPLTWKCSPIKTLGDTSQSVIDINEVVTFPPLEWSVL